MHERYRTRLRPGFLLAACFYADVAGRWMREAPGFATMPALPKPHIWGTSMLETNPIHNQIKDLSERTGILRGYL